jgi:hypothetical protein
MVASPTDDHGRILSDDARRYLAQRDDEHCTDRSASGNSAGAQMISLTETPH